MQEICHDGSKEIMEFLNIKGVRNLLTTSTPATLPASRLPPPSPPLSLRRVRTAHTHPGPVPPYPPLHSTARAARAETAVRMRRRARPEARMRRDPDAAARPRAATLCTRRKLCCRRDSGSGGRGRGRGRGNGAQCVERPAYEF